MKNLLIIAISLFLVQCEPVVPQSASINKKLFFDDHDYEDIVGNVELAPISGGLPSALDNPVIDLSESGQLMISFDLLTDQFENLSARIYHCNKDWKKSILRDMEFLNEINNYRISEFDYSINTVQPYINYRFVVPTPALSGNYVIAIFRRSNPNDLILTRKFLVVETLSAINHLVRMSTTITKRETNHQLEFEVNYGNVPVNSPNQEISVTLLQNHNWGTAVRDVQPTLIRPGENYLEYRHLDLTTNFAAWNDYRFADLRTLDVAGRNVARINKTDFKVTAQLATDKTRWGKTYTQNMDDINGDYIIQTNDIGDVMLNADYATVQFILKSDRVAGDVYVTGRFNNWKLEDRNRMRYHAENKLYYTNMLLKQGYYEYLYRVENGSRDPYFFEGSHFLAENEYEILVYYRRPGNVNDEIIGYKKFKSR